MLYVNGLKRAIWLLIFSFVVYFGYQYHNTRVEMLEQKNRIEKCQLAIKEYTKSCMWLLKGLRNPNQSAFHRQVFRFYRLLFDSTGSLELWNELIFWIKNLILVQLTKFNLGQLKELLGFYDNLAEPEYLSVA